MEIDSPSVSDSESSNDRIVQRLIINGVPAEELDQLQHGLVAYLKSHKGRVSELVSAILPPHKELVEAIIEAKATGSEKSLISSNLRARIHGSMVWLQWMMFEGDPQIAIDNISSMSSGQRGVCGAVWGSNDLAYHCRSCEHDPTCAICVPCFQDGNHKNHDYSIIYTGGGCCDCGDATAWKREGFCSKHKGAEQIQPLQEEVARSVGPVLDALFASWADELLSLETHNKGNPRASDRTFELNTIVSEFTLVVVEMLLNFCKNSEHLLSFVSRRLFPDLLDSLVKAEMFLQEGVVKKLHELLLKLLGEPVFKYEFAKVYVRYYPVIINEAIKKCSDGALKKYPLISAFSVQILTVPTLTPRLVREMDLLEMLFGTLGDIFFSCSGEDGRLQVAKWSSLYETTLRVVEDIRFVVSHVVVPTYIAHERRDLSRTWLRLLTFVQGINPQKREAGIHIEEENDHMHLPFVLGVSIANIHSLLVAGPFSSDSSEEKNGDESQYNLYKQDFDEGDRLRHAKVGKLSPESSASCAALRSKVSEELSDIVPSSVTWLTSECLRAIENWLGIDNTSGAVLNVSSPNTSNFSALKKTLSNRIRKGRYIFKSYSSSSPSNMDLDESIREGEWAMDIEALRVLSLSDWPDIVYDVSSQDISVHIPLHRFLSLLLLKTLRRCYGRSAISNMNSPSSSSTSSGTSHDFFGNALGGCHPYGFSAFVMEHPLRIRVFCAEVHAGMWRKNGDAAMLSCEWYRSVRWSEQGLERDLFLLQCCAALAPADLFVNRFLERFRLSDYLSLNPKPSSEFEAVLLQEMLTLIIQIVKERRFCGLTTAESLQRELIYKLAIGDVTHSQLVKSLPRDISKASQLQQVMDTVAVYSNPSGMKQGKYSLRHSYWKDLDLYHPRWNPRDLQVAEERYLRFCNVSALISQPPRWTKIHPPLSGVARVATCKVVLQIIRSVLYYAVFTDKSASRAPDGVLLTALHLFSLALDICSQYISSRDRSWYTGDSFPVIDLAGEEVSAGANGYHNLLSLLVLLMRMHKKENPGNFIATDSCNLSDYIEGLLKKFAEIDSGCMIMLQKHAPEVVNHLSCSVPNSDTSILGGSASDGEKRKAKAREIQAAILEKMRAEQSKFVASIDSGAVEGIVDSENEQELSTSDNAHESEDSTKYVCSLCHDSNSKHPVSFLILLQKSRLLSFVNRGPPTWESSVPWPDKEHISQSTKDVDDSEIVSPHDMTLLARNALNGFAHLERPGELDAFLEFIRSHFPSIRNILPPGPSNDRKNTHTTIHSLEAFEENMYLSIQREMHASNKFSTAEVGPARKIGEIVLLGKYMAALWREGAENPSSSNNVRSHNGKAPESTRGPSAYDGFGPSDCDGIHLSSCGHAVHQGCLDRYLSSLKERQNRRIIYEGGHIADPDQGEFLCPVCRGLSNSVLPALTENSQKASKLRSAIPISRLFAAGNEENVFLRIEQALSLLQSAANVVGNTETLKAFPTHHGGRIKPNLESLFRVLGGVYFPESQGKFLGSARASRAMIMWDTFKYSIISTEIAARCGKSNMSPTYGLNALHGELLRSPSGFILSLLLKTIHSMRSKDSFQALLRFRGIQLLSGSICSGISRDECSNNTHMQGIDMLSILKYVEKEASYPDIEFLKRVSDPVLALDPFSSLMWVIFCLPYPFLSCEESFLSLVHVFYAVSLTQAIITYRRNQLGMNGEGPHDSLITDIFTILDESSVAQHYFVSKNVGPCCNIKDAIRELSFPYLRRCALLWKLIKYSSTTPFNNRSYGLDGSDETVDRLVKVEELENMFKIPSLDIVLKNDALRSLAIKWFDHFHKEFAVRSFGCAIHTNPAVPFELMQLPHVYQDLLQRYIKQQCPNCKTVQDEPALCLLCGRLCSPGWKPCCKESGCQSHAMACGAGTGVFLLIRKTTILLQRSARQTPWLSPYLDAYGEEDIDVRRGKPLYLNEERYASLTYMVASHGLDRSSKVLRETNIGAFMLV